LTSFQNQISVVIALSHKNVNAKIFKNGTVQVTGCKKEEDGQEVYEILKAYYIRLDSMHTYKEMIERHPGVFITSDDMIISGCIKQVIGYIQIGEVLCINNNDVIINKSGNYMSVKSTSNKRCIYDKNGKYIGNTSVQLYNNGMKLYTNKFISIDYMTDLVYVRGAAIGKIVYNTVEENEDVYNSPEGSNYHCSAFTDNKVTYNNVSVVVNCINISVKLDFCINRQKLYDLLVLDNTVIYDPNSYSAVRLLYNVKSTSNIEYDVSCLIFQSGNVIISGIKAMKDIELILDRFHMEISKHKALVAF
jgi:TATA-box binding protein (TBP) (component of TFIID and TFIIIB)